MRARVAGEGEGEGEGAGEGEGEGGGAGGGGAGGAGEGERARAAGEGERTRQRFDAGGSWSRLDNPFLHNVALTPSLLRVVPQQTLMHLRWRGQAF